MLIDYSHIDMKDKLFNIPSLYIRMVVVYNVVREIFVIDNDGT